MSVGDINVTVTLPTLAEIGSRLTDVERQVLRDYERRMLDVYQDEWVGWKYDGRPPGAPRNVSQQAWRTNVDSTDRGAALIVRNEARDWRTRSREYVSYVHRAGTTTPEWEVMKARVDREIVPDLVVDLSAAVAAAVERPGPPRGNTRRNAAATGPTVRRTLEF